MIETITKMQTKVEKIDFTIYSSLYLPIIILSIKILYFYSTIYWKYIHMAKYLWYINI